MNTDSLPQTHESYVLASLAGDRAAFAHLVEQHKTMVASIAYAAIGDVHASEDIAQQTFVTAWKQLGRLRDPAKLRPWLAGIARNLAHNHQRRRRRDVLWTGLPLDVTNDTELTTEVRVAALDDDARELLWRTVAALPIEYREPLILYYREQESVEHVAGALNLTEDNVRQRLSRGRKLLQDRLAGSIELELRRGVPGAAFTAGVLAAIPALTPTKAVAALAPAIVTAAVAGATGGHLAGEVGAIVGTVCGLLGTVAGIWGARASAKSAAERAFLLRQLWHLPWMLLFVVAWSVLGEHATVIRQYIGVSGYVALLVASQLAYFLAMVVYIRSANRALRAIRAIHGPK